MSSSRRKHSTLLKVANKYRMMFRCIHKFLGKNLILLSGCRLSYLCAMQNPNRIIFMVRNDRLSVHNGCGLFRELSSTGGVNATATTEASDMLNLRDIASSFKEWFKERKIRPTSQKTESLQRDVERICEVLSSGGRENALRDLNVKLTEECVVRVLQRQKDLSAGLKFFEWAIRRRDDGQHSRVAYSTIFKKLSQAKLESIILNWLETFQRKRDVFILRYYETLIMGYAFAGKLEMALQVYARMRFHGKDLDGFGYNLLLSRLVDEEYFDVVDIIWRQIPPKCYKNADIICMMIKSLCKQKRLDEAKKLFNELRRKSFALIVSMPEILVNALCKEKRTKEAFQLVEELRKEGNLSMSKVYDIWIDHLVEQKRVNDALEYYRKRKFEGYVPGHLCYNALANSLLRENRLEEVFDLLIEMRDNHIIPNQRTINATVCFFCKGGMVDVGFDLFNEKLEIGFSPDHMTYDELIKALCKAQKIDEAYKVLREGLGKGYSPDKLTYFILEDALSKLERLDKMCELIDSNDGWLPSSVSICTKYICALCKAGRVNDGYLMLTKMKRKNMNAGKKLYHELLYGFCETKRGEMACKLLLEMQEDGYSVSLSMYKAVIMVLCETGHADLVVQLLDMHVTCLTRNSDMYNAFIKGLCHAGRSDIATRVFEKMLNNSLTPKSESHISLLYGYLKCKRIGDALIFFEAVLSSRCPSTRLYNVLVTGLCKAGDMELGLKKFEEMTGKGLIPNLMCYENLIHVLYVNGKFSKALWVFDHMKMKGRRASSHIYNIVFHCSFNEANISKAWYLFADMCKEHPSPSFKAFCIFVRLLSNAGILELSLGSLEEAIDKFFVPNIVAYNLLLRFVCMEGKIEAAIHLFNRIVEKGCVPNGWSYDILLHCFCKLGMVVEAQKLKEEMLEKGFDPSTWTQRLFKALIDQGM